MSPRQRKCDQTTNENDFSSEFNMIVAKFDALGLIVDCDPATHEFHVEQKGNDKFHLVYRWDEQTREQDLSSFFEDIYLSLRKNLSLGTQKDEYLMY